MTEFKIDQTGSHVTITLDGLDITKAVRAFEFTGDAWHHGRTVVRLDLAVDTVEVNALAERDVTIMVGIRPEAEEALQAIGWVRTSDQTSYRIPREELSSD